MLHRPHSVEADYLCVAPVDSPVLRSKDPLSIHRRSSEPAGEVLDERDLSALAGPSSSSQFAERAAVPWKAANDDYEELAEVDEEDDMDFACAAECAVQQIHGAKNEREALCSAQGLKTTRELVPDAALGLMSTDKTSLTVACARCIDATWPDTSYEDSAVAEYERIAQSCQDDPKGVLHDASF